MADQGLVKLDEIDDIGDEERLAFGIDDFNLEGGDGVLHPFPDSVESVPNLAARRSQVGEDPTGATLTLLVSEDLPLNENQRIVVEKVLSSALAWQGHA